MPAPIVSLLDELDELLDEELELLLEEELDEELELLDELDELDELLEEELELLDELSLDAFSLEEPSSLDPSPSTELNHSGLTGKGNK